MTDGGSSRIPAQPTTNGTLRWAARITVFGTFVVLLARLAELARRFSVDVLYWDQWAFLEPFMRHSPLLDSFRWQHGPHRQGLASLVYAVILPATSWSGRAEGAAIVGAIGAACAVALYVKVRTAGPLGFADVSIPLAFFGLSCVEAFTGAPNLANGPLPLLLCMLTALGLQLRSTAARSAMVAVTGSVAVYTGFALFLAPLTVVLLLFDVRRASSSGDRAFALGALATVALSSLSFFVGYRLDPASPCFHLSSLPVHEYVSFVGGMSARAWGILTPQPPRYLPIRIAIGFVLFLATAAAATWGLAAAWRRGLTPNEADTRRRGETAFLLCGFSVAFVLFSTAGRTCLGLEASLASRYTLYAVPGIFGLYVVARAWPGRTIPSRFVVALIVTLLVLKERFWAFEWRSGGWMAGKKAEWASCYLSTKSVTGCDSSTGFPLYPVAEAPRIGLEHKLDYLERNRLSMFRGSSSVFGSGYGIR